MYSSHPWRFRHVHPRGHTRRRSQGRFMPLAAAIRTIPDYPKKGILFRDITTLLGDAKA
ncbi:MAG: adenine phosphoribosyltransferase, partial [Candidatus Binatia bacterium]